MLFYVSMFYLSFAPLWLSIIFIDVLSIYNTNNFYTITEKCSIFAILSAFIVSSIALRLFFNKRDHNGAQKYRIEDVQEEKTITAEYLLSYILPLFAFDFTLWDQVVLFLIFFLTLGFLCIRHQYFSVNILLELLGYRFYKSALRNEDNILVCKTIISRDKLINRKTNTIEIRPINNEYSYDLTSWNRVGYP